MKKIISLLSAAMLLFGAAAVSVCAEDISDDTEYITVYMTVEKLSLGEGFITAPTAVTVPEGSTAAFALDMLLGEDNYRCSGSIEDSFYISAVRDDETEPQIPAFIEENLDTVNGRYSDEWLSEFDYTNQGGWLYSVNGESMSSTSSNCVLYDGDVVRLQFSLYGYGSDIGFDNTTFGLPPLIAAADKSELIRLVAQYRMWYDEETLTKADAYTDAMEILSRIDCSQDEVNNAAERLAELDPDSETEEEEQPENEVKSDPAAALEAAAAYVRENANEPRIDAVGGDWAVFALARSGRADKDYFDAYYKRAAEQVRQCEGKLSERKFTEFARAVIALTSIGRDPYNVGGYDLIKPLGDLKKVTAQGINGPVFALLALDCGRYEMPENPFYSAAATRKMYVDEILSRQEENGGFALDRGIEPSVDVTAMTLTALSAYLDDERVIEAAEKAVAYLSGMQLPDGGFADDGEECAESAAQVIVALTSVSIPLNDERFVKNGRSVMDNLLSFQTDGGFSHNVGGAVNEMASEQALYALSAYERSMQGKRKLYDMSDVKRDYEEDSAALAWKYLYEGDTNTAKRMLERMVGG